MLHQILFRPVGSSPNPPFPSPCWVGPIYPPSPLPPSRKKSRALPSLPFPSLTCEANNACQDTEEEEEEEEVDPNWGHPPTARWKKKKERNGCTSTSNCLMMCARKEIRMSNSETKAMTGRKFHCLVSSIPIELLGTVHMTNFDCTLCTQSDGPTQTFPRDFFLCRSYDLESPSLLALCEKKWLPPPFSFPTYKEIPSRSNLHNWQFGILASLAVGGKWWSSSLFLFLYAEQISFEVVEWSALYFFVSKVMQGCELRYINKGTYSHF